MRVSIRYYLSERFRLRFEDSGLEDMMEEGDSIALNDKIPRTESSKLQKDEDVDGGSPHKNGDVNASLEKQGNNENVRTLDGGMVGDELEGDAVNYQILLGKIDGLLDKLKLDA